MQQPPVLWGQPLACQPRQVIDIAAGAFDMAKPLRSRPRRSRLADREQRDATLAAAPRQGSHPVRAGAEHRLHTGEVGRRFVPVKNVEQRLDDRLDPAPVERLGESDGLGARPGH